MSLLFFSNWSISNFRYFIWEMHFECLALLLCNFNVKTLLRYFKFSISLVETELTWTYLSLQIFGLVLGLIRRLSEQTFCCAFESKWEKKLSLSRSFYKLTLVINGYIIKNTSQPTKIVGTAPSTRRNLLLPFLIWDDLKWLIQIDVRSPMLANSAIRLYNICVH